MRSLRHYTKTSRAAVLLFIITLVARAQEALAQDKDINININAETDTAWYNLWWVWVIAGALFIIILVAIVSAGKKT
jgi:hypothetical protein